MGTKLLTEACPTCATCGRPVAIAATGRPRRYCSNRCKQKAVRNRRIRLGVALIDWSDEDHRVA